MRDVILHVGIHRTGTTFLQKHYFPFLEGVHFVHQEVYSDPPADSTTGLLKRIVDTNPLFLDLAAEQEALERSLAPAEQSTVVISMEQWFGSLWYGFYNNLDNSQKFKYLFPEARIILTIRRQDMLLESLYRQILRGYAYPTVDTFLNLADGRFLELDQGHRSFPSVSPRTLDFYPYFRNYSSLFGEENVLVLPFERMIQDPDGFFETLCGFIGTEPYRPDMTQRVHESYSLLSSRIALALNKFVRVDWRGPVGLPRFLPHRPLSNYLARQPGGSRFHHVLEEINERMSLSYLLTNVVDRHARAKGNLIDDRTRQLVMDLHRDSNRALDADLGLGLGQYGYY
ncbi:MAG TPA: sulfotransferase [Pseudonocardiaceae bacterium]|nr:sulfotransferase [Pseudonocardiaceae bacterium]